MSGMRWWLAVLLAFAAGCAEEPAPRADAPTPIASDEHGFTGELPAGWELARESLTPRLRNPVEIISAGTVHGARPQSGPCAHVPVGALERIGPRDVFVTVQERLGEPRFPDRPAHFTLPAEVEHTDAAECARNGSRLDVYWFGFRDVRRGFHVLVALGREAPPERRDEALALLDSLRFEPGPEGVHLDPDRAVAFQHRGLAWMMPVPPWRSFDWPLTSVREERLAPGTFDLERTPPIRTARLARRSTRCPPTGRSSTCSSTATAWRRRSAAVRSGSAPRPRGECMRVSRMVRWSQDGRVLQAHVFLGTRAPERLEEEARSILSSIRVE
jgi:hypothetical protein